MTRVIYLSKRYSNSGKKLVARVVPNEDVGLIEVGVGNACKGASSLIMPRMGLCWKQIKAGRISKGIRGTGQGLGF